MHFLLSCFYLPRAVVFLTIVFTAVGFLGIYPSDLQAQISDDPTTGELLENFFRDNEQASETDAQLLLEYLENLRIRPLNLNAAGREDLIALHLLNEIQIENFLTYRNTFGPLLNVYELQAVPAWELIDIRRIMPFATVATGLETRSVPLWRGLIDGEDEIILRWGRRFPHGFQAP